MATRYVVETYTLCDGWINCWSELGEDPNHEHPLSFATKEEAQTEIDELIADTDDAIAAGDMPVGAEYDPKDFRIVELEEYNDRHHKA